MTIRFVLDSRDSSRFPLREFLVGENTCGDRLNQKRAVFVPLRGRVTWQGHVASRDQDEANLTSAQFLLQASQRTFCALVLSSCQCSE